jgi:hypothetical protein
MAYQEKTVQKGSGIDEYGSYTTNDINVFEDEETGNLYEPEQYQLPSPEYGGLETFVRPGKLIATGDALKNPDIQKLIASTENFRGPFENPAIKYRDVGVAQDLYDLKQSNPNAYYNQLAIDIGNQIGKNTAWNEEYRSDDLKTQLNEIKEVNPAAYYTAQFGILGSSYGHESGQNREDRNVATLEKIKSFIPDAMASGLSNEQINSIISNNANTAYTQNVTKIANTRNAGYNFMSDTFPALAIFGGAVGGAALGGAFSGAGAAGGGAGGLTAASVPSLTTGLEVGTGSALAGTGAGAAAVPAGGAVSSLGSLAWNAPAIGGSAGFFNPTLGADVASTGFGLSAADIPSLTSGLEVGTSGALNDLNPSQDPSIKDVLTNANRARKIADLLGQDSSQATRSATGTTGSNPQQLASLLSLPTQAAPGNIYRMNQNPFNFGTQGQTVASPGTYDVSGTNPMANSLRNYRA